MTTYAKPAHGDTDWDVEVSAAIDGVNDHDTRIAALEATAGAVAVTANTQTGTTYTLVLGDAGKVVEMNNASANVLTIPPNSSVAFPTGTVLEVCQYGAGQTTISPGSGVTLRPAGTLAARTQYSTVGLRKRGTNEWVLAGDLQ